MRLAAADLGVVAQHHVVEEGEEGGVLPGFHLEGGGARAGGHGHGDLVLVQVADQPLGPWGGEEDIE